MRIRRLKLTGFKSFVDPVELLIEPGLTGIVGPNGCGKSNLLEAIRWVMGEGSPRSLRGGGMEDVIFAGTASRPARDFAEVAMALDRIDADGGAIEAHVIRRIERGAGSAYRLDGGDVRQKDVALLFADAATGAHSPALVSQGRIGAIIAARPAERRAMLEEAAGIAGLHVRRRDAEQKLHATGANLERLDQLIGDMDGRAQALRRQARAAERYRSVSAAIRVAEGRLIYARWRDAAAAAGAAKRDAEAAEQIVAAAGEAQRIANLAMTAATATLAAARSGAQAARDAAGAANHRVDTLDRERAGIQRRIADIAAMLTSLERDRAREEALGADAAAAIARLDAEGATSAGRVAIAVAARPGLAGRLQATEAGLRDGEVALARALATEASEQADARIACAAMLAARQRLDRAVAELGRVEAEVAAIGDIGRCEADLVAVQRRKLEGEAQAVAAAAAIAAAETARAAAVAARDAAQSDAAGRRAALASLDGEAKALARSMPHAARDRVLDRLEVAPGCERALAAALGDDLDAPATEVGVPRWQGSISRDDPPLAPGCTPLSIVVRGVEALARRLAQIGMVEADDGRIALAVGQRLVTRDGRMRRWDGFVAEDRGAATAQALIRRNRLAEIERELPDLRASLAAADATVRRASDMLDRVAREGQAARAAQQAAERQVRDAMLAEDRARGAIERIVARRADLDRRDRRAREDRVDAATDADAATATLAELPDGAETGRMVAARRDATDIARAQVMQHRGDLAALDGGLEADRERISVAAADASRWRSRADDAARRIEEVTARVAATQSEAATLATAPAKLARRTGAARVAAADAGAAVVAAADDESAAAAIADAAEARLASVSEAVTMAREARATAIARFENQELRRVEMGRVSGERFQCPAPGLPERAGFERADIGDVTTESQRFERLGLDRERLGPVNLVAGRELADLDAERTAQAAQRDELVEAVARLRGSIGSLNREGRARLLAAFEAVDGHFRRLFARLFAGGEAHLTLVDSDEPLEAGLEIMAQPPGKRLTSLTLLSGGEQALTACALIFALFLTNPAPICVLDEVDAPLDDANVERFCDLLDRMVRETETRYLVVTHNAVTMARMHRLFGVTMIERGVSRLVSVDLGGAETLLAAE